MMTNEIIDDIDALEKQRSMRDAENAKYLAAYDVACSLAIFVEHIECGYTLKADGTLALDAKAKLRKLAELDGSDFFTRFERIKR